MLMDGHLVVHVNAGDRASTRKVVLQSANGTYSDGQEHSVILIRKKRYVGLDQRYPFNYGVPLSARCPLRSCPCQLIRWNSQGCDFLLLTEVC